MTKFFYNLVDQNGRAYFTYNAVMRWLGLQIQNIGLMLNIGALLTSYITAAQSRSVTSEMALAVTSTFSLVGLI